MSSQQGPIRLAVVAECYANTGFAGELIRQLRSEIARRSLRERICVEAVHHTPTSGRDAILRRIVRFLNLLIHRHEPPVVGIVVIDYETGLMRRYVYELLRHDVQRGLSRFNRILVRVGATPQELKPLVGIVFDPRIEEALICEVNTRYCRDIRLLRLVRSHEGANIVARLLRSNERCRSLIRELTKVLLDSAIPQALELCRSQH